MPSYQYQEIKNDPELFTFVEPFVTRISYKYDIVETKLVEYQLRYNKRPGFYFTALVDDEYLFVDTWDDNNNQIAIKNPFLRNVLWEYIEVRKITSVAKWNLVRISSLILMVYGVLDTNSDKFKQLFAVGRRAKPSMLYKCLVKLKEDNIV